MDIRAYFSKVFYAVMISSLQPKQSAFVQLKAALSYSSPSYARTMSTVNLVDRIIPGIASRISRWMLRNNHFPWEPGNIQLIAFGSGAAVFNLNWQSGAKALRIYRKSLGKSASDLLGTAEYYKKNYETVLAWYGGSLDLVLPMEFLVLQGLPLIGPIAASLQPYIQAEKRDIFEDFTDTDFVKLMEANPFLRDQFLFFVEQTLHQWDEGKICYDFVGRENLLLVKQDGSYRLKIVDVGFFKFDLPEFNHPGKIAQIEQKNTAVEVSLSTGKKCLTKLMQNLAQSSNLKINHANMVTYDFDLHGIVGIRLINAGPRDLAAVKRQLGPIQSVLTRDPDIVIRFVDRMQLSSPVRYIGVEDAGFTEDAFLILRGKYQTSIKVQIPFDQIGSHQCEIVCESGVPAVPLLIAIINLTALSKDVLPLHASALFYNGKGILITGWSKGGKTETLLAFAANGATYVGDEWIYLSADGQRMYGIPEPTRIWYWHLQEMPRYKAMVKRKDLRRLQALNLFAKILKRLEFSPLKRRVSYLQALKRLTALVQRQLYVQLPPEKLFGQMAKETDVSPEKIFFVVSHDQPDVTVQPTDSQELAERMVFSLQEERMEFLSYYFKYRFAFPKCSNPLIDQAEEIQRRLMLRAVANKEAYAIYHPYPFSIPSLFDTIRPYCE